MQKQRTIYLIAGLVWSFSLSFVNGQVNNILPASKSGENIEIFTDRSIFGVGEEIYFSTVYSKPGDIAPDWSKILYAELIKWNGSKIASVKVPLVKNSGSGILAIPANLETGVYYLRAYTKWMRNFSPYEYSYRTLRIVNPLSSKTEKGPAEQADLTRIDSVKIQMLTEEIEFRGLNKEYETRQAVDLEIKTQIDYPSGIYSISVVRNGSLDMESSSFSMTSLNNEEIIPTLEFYPEIRGLSLSGKLLDKDTKDPIKQTRVDLSSVANPFYFASAKTGDDGSFLFTFPQSCGTHEFHLTNEGDANVSFLIDADFCSRPVTLPYIPFQLKEDERELVSEIVTNSQIDQKFRSSASETTLGDSVYLPFYGQPTRTIYEKDFIELNDLQEFLYELVYEVTVREREGKKRIFFIGQSTLSSYPPLVLLDNIPVRNIDELLKVGCRRIDRIELLNAGYVMGYFLHSGIISIYSEGKDMAGLKQGENSNFFSLDLFEFPEPYYPEYNDSLLLSRIPDRRNTLFWMPAVEIRNGESTNIHFYTGDASGEYSVYLTGVDKDGRRVLSEGPSFIVK